MDKGLRRILTNRWDSTEFYETHETIKWSLAFLSMCDPKSQEADASFLLILPFPSFLFLRKKFGGQEMIHGHSNYDISPAIFPTFCHPSIPITLRKFCTLHHFEKEFMCFWVICSETWEFSDTCSTIPKYRNSKVVGDMTGRMCYIYSPRGWKKEGRNGLGTCNKLRPRVKKQPDNGEIGGLYLVRS